MNVSQNELEGRIKYHLAQAPFNIHKNEKLKINAAAANKPYINYCYLLLFFFKLIVKLTMHYFKKKLLKRIIIVIIILSKPAKTYY